MKHKKKYMLLAIELAKRGFASVEPNPMVGCVIVSQDGNVIGEGWHKSYGAEHAEVNALADCRRRGHSPKGAVMCVTLEPCCHHGKTPPCTDAIIAAGIAKVFVACQDPSDKVAGKGIEQLRQAQIDVSVGLCAKQAALLNRAFIKYSQTSLPWVVLKWAQTIDGKLSAEGLSDDDRWLSNDTSRKDVHKLRRSCQAILVGIDTALIDDPLLTARPAKGRSPLRVVLDSKLRIGEELKLLATIDQAALMIVTTKQAQANNAQKVSILTKLGAEVVAVDADENSRCSLPELLQMLGQKGVQKLLVEGGAEVITSFIEQSLGDEAVVYIAPKLFGSFGGASLPAKLDTIAVLPKLFDTTTELFGSDVKIAGNFRSQS